MERKEKVWIEKYDNGDGKFEVHKVGGGTWGY